MDSTDVQRAASQASNHPVIEAGARTGYAVSGVLHLLIGWIGVEVALGVGKQADQSGALASLAGNGLGQVVLWVSVLGFLGLALWQAADAVAIHPGRDRDVWGGRAKAVSKAILYFALAWSAFQFARGRASNSRTQSIDFTASLLAKPGGRGLVVAVGLLTVGVGAYHVYKGATKSFLGDLTDNPGRWATRAGQIGYVAKGVALGIVGFLFVAAGIHQQASEASGLDGALKSLRDKPFGSGLLIVMSLGFAAYGLYSFSRARHARV